MDYNFLRWYNFAYCLEDFETIDLYAQHKNASYVGWLAAIEKYDIAVPIDF